MTTKPRSSEIHPGPGFRVQMNFVRLAPELMRRLAVFPTPDISDLLNRLYAVSPAIRCLSGDAHKLGGPPGVGVLLVKDLATLEPVGGQERGYRRGTQDAPNALAFAAALAARPYDMNRLAALRSRLEADVKESGGVVIGEESPRISTIGAYAQPSAASASLLVQFDLAGIAVSAGSACSSGAMKESVVLAAMNVPADVASSFIRVSFGPNTSEADVDRFLVEWKRIASRAQAA